MPDATPACENRDQDAVFSNPADKKNDLGLYWGSGFLIRAPINPTNKFGELYLRTQFFSLTTILHSVTKIA